jgi:hypothetical protein
MIHTTAYFLHHHQNADKSNCPQPEGNLETTGKLSYPQLEGELFAIP